MSQIKLILPSDRFLYYDAIIEYIYQQQLTDLIGVVTLDTRATITDAMLDITLAPSEDHKVLATIPGRPDNMILKSKIQVFNFIDSLKEILLWYPGSDMVRVEDPTLNSTDIKMIIALITNNIEQTPDVDYLVKKLESRLNQHKPTLTENAFFRELAMYGHYKEVGPYLFHYIPEELKTEVCDEGGDYCSHFTFEEVLSASYNDSNGKKLVEFCSNCHLPVNRGWRSIKNPDFIICSVSELYFILRHQYNHAWYCDGYNIYYKNEVKEWAPIYEYFVL